MTEHHEGHVHLTGSAESNVEATGMSTSGEVHLTGKAATEGAPPTPEQISGIAPGNTVPEQILSTDTVFELTKLFYNLGNRVREILDMDPSKLSHEEALSYLAAWPSVKQYYDAAFHMRGKDPEEVITREAVEESLRDQYAQLLKYREEGALNKLLNLVAEDLQQGKTQHPFAN